MKELCALKVGEQFFELGNGEQLSKLSSEERYVIEFLANLITEGGDPMDCYLPAELAVEGELHNEFNPGSPCDPEAMRKACEAYQLLGIGQEIYWPLAA